MIARLSVPVGGANASHRPSSSSLRTEEAPIEWHRLFRWNDDFSSGRPFGIRTELSWRTESREHLKRAPVLFGSIKDVECRLAVAGATGLFVAAAVQSRSKSRSCGDDRDQLNDRTRR